MLFGEDFNFLIPLVAAPIQFCFEGGKKTLVGQANDVSAEGRFFNR